MTRKLCTIGLTFLVILGFVAARHKLVGSTICAQAHARGKNATLASSDVLMAYGKLPLSFEANKGQTDPRVDFLARGSGYTVFLRGDGATLLLDTRSAKLGPASAKSAIPPVVTKSIEYREAALKLALAGSNQRAEAEALDLQPGASNYLIGNDPSQWRRNVPHFAQVKYRGVYPGVDLIYYGNQGQLESDYVVAPGASPSHIAMRIEGASKIKLNSQGDLVVATKAGSLLLHKPRAYQRTAGPQQEIAAHFVQHGSQLVGIEVASYDAKQPLVIDPILSYSTYLGGTSNQFLTGIAADSTGSAYVTGSTTSSDFPTVAGSFQTTLSNTTGNAFITKLKPDGTGLVYSTYLGGTGTKGDASRAIAVDTAGDAYIVGFSSSTDFPITAGTAYQSVNKGGGGFFTKLDPTGSTLMYSTYLSGSASDSLNAVALDTNGNAYITGATTSTDFPIVLATAVQTTNNTTATQVGTAFLSRINPTLGGIPSLVYSTFLGGSKQDSGLGVAVDSAFNAYITGYTSSTDFPQPATPNGFQTTLKNPSGNAFVAQIDTTQPALLVYSTYLGGSANGQGSSPGDVGSAIAVPAAGGLAYITGYTYATDFPTVTPLSTTSNTPFQKAIIAQVNTTKSGAASLTYSTYFGGTVLALGSTQHGADLGFGIAVDSLKNIYVAGTTSSADFPVTPGAPQPSKIGIQNAFFSELNPAGSTVLFSTYLGGSNDAADAIALDAASPANAYIAGVTSGNFPTTAVAFQNTDGVTGNNNNDGFVAKISPGAATGVFLSPAFLAFGKQIVTTPSTAKTVTLFNNSATTLSGITISFTGTNAADFTQSTSSCGPTLAASSTCTIAVIFTPSTTSSETAALSIADSDTTSPQTLSLIGTGTAAPTGVFVSPTTLNFGNQTLNATSPAQIVTLSNNTKSTLSGVTITLAGTSPAAFAQTTTCGTTVAAGANCAISVTFTPTTAAAVTATLSVADSDASSPQTVALSGTGTTGSADFSVAVSPAMTSVAAGSTANITVTVAGLNGFTTPVALTCTGAPLGSTCMLTPATVTPTATGATASAAIVTTARTMATWVAPPDSSLRSGPRYATAIWPVTFALLLFGVGFARRQPTAKKLAWVCSVLLAVSLTSCSGLPNTGTPAGIYTITITGTSGTLTHQVTVSLTVT